MKLEYIPVVGLVWSIVGHLLACKRHADAIRKKSGQMRINSLYDETWEWFGRFHVALLTTFLPAILVIGVLMFIAHLGMYLIGANR